ncbi:hypothetical protein ACNTMW_15715 [Planosporangium sp. 12N6]|uniref:hypothetical protein n=1 Tax=Planosporangium spinosum TaxID=3402278 RepID=UPI003CF2B5D3
MGALVTLELAPDSPLVELPWIITFGPLNDDDEWEPVVCGPYERAHAMALAESVVADEELMAVVEPVQPHVSLDQIRGDIAAARLAAVDDGSAFPDGADYTEADFSGPDLSADGHGEMPAVPTPPPSPEQVRAGFARIATRLTEAG